MVISRICLMRFHSYLLLIILCVPNPAWAEEGIEMLVSVPENSGTDEFARLIAQTLSKYLVKEVKVINITGNGVANQLNRLGASRPDGTTIGLVSLTQVVSLLHRKTNYSLADFEWISMVDRIPYILVSSENSNISSVVDIVAAAPKKSTKLKVAAFRKNSPAGIAWHLLASSLGLREDQYVHVPYSGTKNQLKALLRNDVDITLSFMSTINSSAQGSKVNILGVVSQDRLSIAPNVPALSEVLSEVAELEQFRGIIAPAGVDTELLKKISDAMVQVLSDPEVEKYYEKLHLVPGTTDRQNFKEQILSYEEYIMKSGFPFEQSGISEFMEVLRMKWNSM